MGVLSADPSDVWSYARLFADKCCCLLGSHNFFLFTFTSPRCSWLWSKPRQSKKKIIKFWFKIIAEKLSEKLFLYYDDNYGDSVKAYLLIPPPFVQCWLKAVGCIVYFWLDFALFQLMNDASFHSHCTVLCANIIITVIHPPTQTLSNMEATLFTQENTHLTPIASHYLVKQQPLWMSLGGCTVKPGMRISESCQWTSCNRKAEMDTVQRPMLKSWCDIPH